MSEEDTGAEAIISDEELNVDLTPSGNETFEELTQKLANAEKAKKQILARARKAEEKLKEHSAPKVIAPATPKVETAPDDRLWEIAEMIQQGYTKADADFIARNGGREAMSDQNSYVSIAMRTLREQRSAEQAAGATQSNAGMSDVERKYTPEQLKNMSVAELEKLLPHASD